MRKIHMIHTNGDEFSELILKTRATVKTFLLSFIFFLEKYHANETKIQK